MRPSCLCGDLFCIGLCAFKPKERDDYCDSDSYAIGSDGHHRCRFGERCPFYTTEEDAKRHLDREADVDRQAARLTAKDRK